jgi:serine/threonine-protein kinase
VDFGNSSAAKNILAHPELADRFEIVEVLGFGSEAFVYLARDRACGGREVALKLLVDDKVFAAETTQRFLDEASLSAEIQHPNIVKSYDIIQLDGTVAMTMEFVDGEDLAERLKRGAIPNEQVEHIFVQLCSALEALHAHGICHRDLKLENIFLRADGVVKLGDFGLMLRPQSGEPRSTCLLGTPPYMPPEYVEGGAYDYRGDLWAAGLVLYEIATGRRRLAGKHGSAALDYLVKTDYRIPALTLAGLPKKFVRIIERALEIEPLKRFQSAQEMRAAMLDEGEGDPREPIVRVEPRLQLNSYLTSKVGARSWTRFVSLRGVALILGAFFVSILALVWIFGAEAWVLGRQFLGYLGL